ncbi:MAG: GAF domain-containing protein [Leptospiraceae bacterium]|nr:GAF domain-containing protein [Leptospiraceae bacterium]
MIYEVIISGADYGKRKTDVIPGLYQASDGRLYLDAIELENLSQQARNLNILIESARSIMAEISLDSLLDLIIQNVKSVMNADRATLFLADKENTELRSRVALGSREEIRIPFGTGIAGFVAQSRETVNIRDAYSDPRFNSENDQKSGYRSKSILCMPVYNSLKEIIGVIQVLNKIYTDHFTEKDEALLGAYASLAGISLTNAQAYDELQKEKDNLEQRVKERTKDLASALDKSDKLLLNILPAEVAEELKETGEVTPIHFDSVTIMFTDFKDFTHIAEGMSPPKLIRELDGYFTQFDKTIERYNLEKLKTIGDSYMCAGGIPRVTTTHPLESCLAALEIQSFMSHMKEIKEKMKEPYWELRLGIHTGSVMAGVVGERKFAYDVWGDTVNTASRMEFTGTVGKINISEATYELVKDFFECEFRGEVEAKNKGKVKMYFLNRINTEYSLDKDGFVPNEKFLTHIAKQRL